MSLGTSVFAYFEEINMENCFYNSIILEFAQGSLLLLKFNLFDKSSLIIATSIVSLVVDIL